MIACSSSIKVHIIGKTISHYRVIEKFAVGGIWCCVQAGGKPAEGVGAVVTAARRKD